MTETLRDAVAKRDGQPPADPNKGGVLALTDSQTWWTPRQLAALKALGIKNATQEDLLVFMHYCAKTRLDPFSRQVYMIERRAKEDGEWVYRQTIVVGIDGYRVVAQRAAKREGCHLEYEDTVWFGPDKSRHEIWLDGGVPAGALVTVVKVIPDGTRLRYPGMAVFESYAARSRQDKSLQGQWAVMPDHMIEKCAEAFALRRAFPNDLSGTYVEEELQHEPPPLLPARRRPPQAEDELTIQVHADDASDAEDAAAGREDAQPAEPTRRQANAKMNAIFKHYGMHGPDQAEDRRAVVSSILSTPELVEFAALSDDDVIRAAKELSVMCAEVERAGGNAPEVLAAYAAAYLTHLHEEATDE